MSSHDPQFQLIQKFLEASPHIPSGEQETPSRGRPPPSGELHPPILSGTGSRSPSANSSANSKRDYATYSGTQGDPIDLEDEDSDSVVLEGNDTVSVVAPVVAQSITDTLYKPGMTVTQYAEAHRNSCFDTAQELIPPTEWSTRKSVHRPFRFRCTQESYEGDETVAELLDSGMMIVHRNQALQWLSNYSGPDTYKYFHDEWMTRRLGESGKIVYSRRGKELDQVVFRALTHGGHYALLSVLGTNADQQTRVTISQLRDHISAEQMRSLTENVMTVWSGAKYGRNRRTLEHQFKDHKAASRIRAGQERKKRREM